MTTVKEVADWMLDQLKERSFLDQAMAVRKIKNKFGNDFVYKNKNGNLAIDKGVLKEFRKISKPDIVWVRGEKVWRHVRGYDKCTGRQTD